MKIEVYLNMMADLRAENEDLRKRIDRQFDRLQMLDRDYKELKERTNRLINNLKSFKQQLAPKKITLKEFFESEQELAVRCDTKEKAKKLLSAFAKMGKKWKSGCSYTERTYWTYYMGETLYCNDGTFASRCLGRGTLHAIYEFEEVDLTTPEEKKVLRTIDEVLKEFFSKEEDK